MNTPCKDCSNRYIGCHGLNEDGSYKCKEYGSFRKTTDMARENRTKENRIIGTTIANIYRVEKAIKYGRRRKD